MENNQTKIKNTPVPIKIYLSALLGVFMEYVDYTLYGFSAPFIAVSFFPHGQHALDLLFTWAIFAIGFLLRPLGGLIFGHLGDRFGRRSIMTFNILLMSGATITMGLLPTYQRIGLLAPIFLIICRALQGLAVSTEYSGCSVYILEFKKTGQGLISGVITSATGFGVFAASLLVLLFNSHLVHLPMLEAWRWPFIFAGVAVGLLGFYFRRNLAESPTFLEAKKRQELVKFPFLYLLQKNKLIFAKNIIISGYVGVAIILTEVYLSSYLQLHYAISKEHALQLSTYLAFLEACFAILWGAFSDCIGKRTTMRIGGLLMLIGIFPLLHLFECSDPVWWFLAGTGIAFSVAAVDGPLAAFLTTSFPTKIRYTGVSLSYNFGAAIIGGMSPTIIEGIQHLFGNSNVFGWYLIFGACTMILCLWKTA